jgi:hypothetical protein
VDLFCFASDSIGHVEIAVKTRLWAVARTTDSDNLARTTKAKRYMKVGSFGIFYCSDRHAFTTPFMTLSPVDQNRIVSDVWSGSWCLPFRILPLGTTTRLVGKDIARSNWPVLRNSRVASVSAAMNLTGTTVFVPKEISPEDWELIVKDLIA